jgi:hypothetical protein
MAPCHVSAWHALLTALLPPPLRLSLPNLRALACLRVARQPSPLLVGVRTIRMQVVWRQGSRFGVTGTLLPAASARRYQPSDLPYTRLPIRKRASPIGVLLHLMVCSAPFVCLPPNLLAQDQTSTGRLRRGSWRPHTSGWRRDCNHRVWWDGVVEWPNYFNAAAELTR